RPRRTAKDARERRIDASETLLESVRPRRFNPATARARRASRHGRNVMAKGQMRSNKEKKKPKAEWNKKKKGGPTLSPFALARYPARPGQTPFGKKSEAHDGEAISLAGGSPGQSAAWAGGRHKSQRYSAAIILPAAEWWA